MHKIFAGLALMLFGAAPVYAQDNPKCNDNPLFSRFAGEKLSTCERMRFFSLELWRWKKADDPKSGTEPHRVEGEYWYYVNDIARDAQGRHPGKVEVRRNFEQAVRAAGGSIIGADGATVAYRIVRPDGEYWGQSGCGRGGDECSQVLHRIVRAAGMQQSVGVLGGTATVAGAAAPAPGGAYPMPDGRPNQTSASEVGVLPAHTGMDKPVVFPPRPDINDPRRPMMRLTEMRRPPDESFAHGWIDILDAKVGSYERGTKVDRAGGMSIVTTQATVLIRARAADGSERVCVFPVCSLSEAVALASVVTQPYASVVCTNGLGDSQTGLGTYAFRFEEPVSRAGRDR